MDNLKNKIIARNIIELKIIDSTNSYAMELLKTKNEQIAEGTVIITKNQTAGRGQTGNTWESETEKNLTLSIILYPDFIEPSQQFLFNKAISLGITDYLKNKFPDLTLKIKWPNDIYVGDKKIAGILIENIIIGNKFSGSVVGIGLNVNQTIFSKNITNPTSMKLIIKKNFDIDKCLENLCMHIEKRYLQLKSGNYEKINFDYLNTLFRYEQFHYFNYKNKKIKARITGVSDYGELLLTDENNKKLKCIFKEIDFIV
ncbi:MAG: biotin--[acetyl-CoA-carboxylase] ligase [Bacteroidales bacterium]|jgi:BirA family biotin operon repressor/biotin-[acetyl-CoA-carboxylase] ligase